MTPGRAPRDERRDRQVEEGPQSGDATRAPVRLAHLKHALRDEEERDDGAGDDVGGGACAVAARGDHGLLDDGAGVVEGVADEDGRDGEPGGAVEVFLVMLL